MDGLEAARWRPVEFGIKGQVIRPRSCAHTQQDGPAGGPRDLLPVSEP
jgi:hypothetical protein